MRRVIGSHCIPQNSSSINAEVADLQCLSVFVVDDSLGGKLEGGLCLSCKDIQSMHVILVSAPVLELDWNPFKCTRTPVMLWSNTTTLY